MSAVDDAPRWQARLIGTYGSLAERGLLDNRLARAGFETGYGAYKALFEAGSIGRLRPYAPPGTLVIDVGANVGFFTARFARWVRPGGRVLALEPEAVNAERLGRRVRRRRFDHVEVVRAVATDHDGTALLAVNRRHPGDHKIGAEGEAVAAHTIDALVRDRPARRVSLIKIDVQGAELAVLRGAAATLAEHRPALFVEIHEPSLQAFGTSGREVLEHLAAQGYRAHRVSRRGVGPEETPAELAAAFAQRYGDALFLAGPGRG